MTVPKPEFVPPLTVLLVSVTYGTVFGLYSWWRSQKMDRKVDLGCVAPNWWSGKARKGGGR